MKHYTSKGRGRCAALAFALPLVAGVPAMAFVPSSMVTISQTASAISGVNQLNATTFEVRYQNGQVLTIDFYGENIFRLFQDNKGGKVRNPQAQPPAQILVNNPRKSVEHINLTKDNGYYIIATPKVQLRLNATSGLLSVLNGEGASWQLPISRMQKPPSHLLLNPTNISMVAACKMVVSPTEESLSPSKTRTTGWMAVWLLPLLSIGQQRGTAFCGILSSLVATISEQKMLRK